MAVTLLEEAEARLEVRDLTMLEEGVVVAERMTDCSRLEVRVEEVAEREKEHC